MCIRDRYLNLSNFEENFQANLNYSKRLFCLNFDPETTHIFRKLLIKIGV
jgi:hypothetical protein